jgi:hypothetical protein
MERDRRIHTFGYRRDRSARRVGRLALTMPAGAAASVLSKDFARARSDGCCSDFRGPAI